MNIPIIQNMYFYFIIIFLFLALALFITLHYLKFSILILIQKQISNFYFFLKKRKIPFWIFFLIIFFFILSIIVIFALILFPNHISSINSKSVNWLSLYFGLLTLICLIVSLLVLKTVSHKIFGVKELYSNFEAILKRSSLFDYSKCFFFHFTINPFHLEYYIDMYNNDPIKFNIYKEQINNFENGPFVDNFIKDIENALELNTKLEILISTLPWYTKLGKKDTLEIINFANDNDRKQLYNDFLLSPLGYFINRFYEFIINNYKLPEDFFYCRTENLYFLNLLFMLKNIQALQNKYGNRIKLIVLTGYLDYSEKQLYDLNVFPILIATEGIYYIGKLDLKKYECDFVEIFEKDVFLAESIFNSLCSEYVKSESIKKSEYLRSNIGVQQLRSTLSDIWNKMKNDVITHCYIFNFAPNPNQLLSLLDCCDILESEDNKEELNKLLNDIKEGRGSEYVVTYIKEINDALKANCKIQKHISLTFLKWWSSNNERPLKKSLKKRHFHLTR